MSTGGRDWLLDLAKIELRDDDVEDACQQKIDVHRPRNSGKAERMDSLDYQEIDVSQNFLAWRGCGSIVNIALQCQDLRVVKLFRNELTDRAAGTICRLVEECVVLEQLHLSYNRFTNQGAKEMIMAAHRGRGVRRDSRKEREPVTLWMRLEHNRIRNPAGMLEDLWEKRVDFCEARDAQACGPRVCKRCALVHLPYFSKQDALAEPAEAPPLAVTVDPYGGAAASEGGGCGSGAVAGVTARGAPAAGAGGTGGEVAIVEVPPSTKPLRSPCGAQSGGFDERSDEEEGACSAPSALAVAALAPAPAGSAGAHAEPSSAAPLPSRSTFVAVLEAPPGRWEVPAAAAKAPPRPPTAAVVDASRAQLPVASVGAAPAAVAATSVQQAADAKKRDKKSKKAEKGEKTKEKKDKVKDKGEKGERKRKKEAADDASSDAAARRRRQKEVVGELVQAAPTPSAPTPAAPTPAAPTPATPTPAAPTSASPVAAPPGAAVKPPPMAVSKAGTAAAAAAAAAAKASPPAGATSAAAAEGEAVPETIEAPKPTPKASAKATVLSMKPVQVTRRTANRGAAAVAAQLQEAFEDETEAKEKKRKDAKEDKDGKDPKVAKTDNASASAAGVGAVTPAATSVAATGAAPTEGGDAVRAANGGKDKADQKPAKGGLAGIAGLAGFAEIQKMIAEEKSKLRLFVIKAKSDWEAKREDNRGLTNDQEYYIAKQDEVLGNDGEFRNEGSIGKGVFSSVFRCKDTRLGSDKHYALKFVRSNVMMRKVAEKEVETYRKLMRQCPKLDAEGAQYLIGLAASETFVHQGHLCMVFELLKCDLRTALSKYGQGRGLPLQTVAQYSRQMFMGLRALRKMKIVHGDLKPDNVLMSLNKTEVKICDFGSAMDAGEEVNTPYLQPRYYRAPEIMIGSDYDTQIDVWSAAITLFELATGKILFTGKTNNQMLQQMLEVCGVMERRMACSGSFSSKHFTEMGDFLSKDPTSITGQPEVMRMKRFLKPVRPLLPMIERIKQEPPPNADTKTQERLCPRLADLVSKCLRLDPSERFTPEHAIASPFYKKDK